MGSLFGFKPDLVKAKACCAQFAAIIVEARFISIVEDKTLSPEVQKKKVNVVMNKIGEYSQRYDVDLKHSIHVKIMGEAMNKVVLSG